MTKDQLREHILDIWNFNTEIGDSMNSKDQATPRTGHTPTPWSQGTTLNTQQTRRWSKEQIESNNHEERRRIFSNFSSEDEGRSRRFICVCENEEDARLIVKAVNEYDDNIKTIEALRADVNKVCKLNYKLFEALKALYNHTADYIKVNSLGDIHHNHSMKLAHKALQKSEGL